FRIPYYVGPLNGYHSDKGGNSWVVKKTEEKIYPWNFEKVVDIEESANRFIRRMTNKCTYLFMEDVVPKDSILYSKFSVLNEINRKKHIDNYRVKKSHMTKINILTSREINLGTSKNT